MLLASAFVITSASPLLAMQADAAQLKHIPRDEFPSVFKQLKQRAKLLLKSEYETTQQYQGRIAGLAEKDQALMEARIFIFSNEVLYRKEKRLRNSERITYDADEQRITVAFWPSDTDTSSSGFKIYRLDEKITPLGSYSGTNAYGAAARITKEDIHYRCLAFPNEAVPPKEMQFSYAGKFDAKRKTAVALAVMGDVIAPYLFESLTYHDPTLRAPQEQKFTESCIALRPEHFVLFDIKTGDVLGEFDMAKQ